MSLLQDIWSAVTGIGKGMTKTFDEQFDPVFTQMYPFDMPKLPPVSVQSLALIQNEDGSDRCVSCLACEKVCPSQVITIERKKNPAGKGFVLERFDIDLVNCMYCAACVESCPASAIVTIQDFEMSTPNLQTLKADKEFLDLQGLRAQQWYSPKIGVEYRENVSEQNLHGAIVKAPLEEQPGGLAALEKIKAEGGELPAPGPKAPAFAMSELPVAVYADFVHEPVGRALEPVAVSTVSSQPAPVVAAPAAPSSEAAPVAAPAAGGAPRSKKIKRWGEPKGDDEAVSSEPAPVTAQPAAPVEAPKVEASSAAPASSPPVVSSEPAPPSSEPAPAPSSDAAPAADAKPRSPKIKRWEPKN
jgi:NADH-quinone oxidoreductase subunit I